MNDYNQRILTQYDIGRLRLRNRLAVAPMTRVSATEAGPATAEMARYYERFAKGRFGLVITEELYTDQKYDQGYHFKPGINNNKQNKDRSMLRVSLSSRGSAISSRLRPGVV